MALKQYKPGTTFPGRMGRTIGESEPAWPAPLRAKDGAPNVLFMVLDTTPASAVSSVERRRIANESLVIGERQILRH